MYWKITPHKGDADYCVMPAGTEQHDREALAYAQERLEAEWDELWIEPGFERIATVQIELCEGEMPTTYDGEEE